MSDLRTRQAAVEPVEARHVVEWAAHINLRAQERLFNLICVEQAESGRDLEEVAERIGIEQDELREVLSGRVDLTLSEVRQLAIACDVVISYEVEPATIAYEHAVASAVAARHLRATDQSQTWDETSTSAIRQYLVSQTA